MRLPCQYGKMQMDMTYVHAGTGCAVAEGVTDDPRAQW